MSYLLDHEAARPCKFRTKSVFASSAKEIDAFVTDWGEGMSAGEEGSSSSRISRSSIVNKRSSRDSEGRSKVTLKSTLYVTKNGISAPSNGSF